MSNSLLNKDYAVYLPAVNDTFAADVLKPLKSDRPFPAGLELKDLIFWDKNNKLWHYSHILHSVGLHKVNSSPNNAVTQAGRTDCFLLGDSGGFQIGTGAIKGYDKLKGITTGDEAVAAWAGAYEVRKWILEWLELHTDYAMTIDMPLWARLEKRSDTPFHNCSVRQLTDMTVENLQFIDRNRQGRTKWLNVIQGLDEKTTEEWWAAVKWFDCGGYALAGSAGISGGIKGVLKTILMIRDDGVLAEGRNWIHTLGVSTPKWAILLTAIQRALRKTVNPKMQISFDSSTPFQEAGIRENVISSPAFTSRPADWVFEYVKVPQSAKLAGSTAPLPYRGPLAQKLTLGDLNVRGGAWTPRSFDTVSNLLLCNINCWSMLDAFKRANDIAFASDRKDLPAIWGDCLDFIDDLFTVNDWATRLEAEKRMLNAVAPAT